MKINLKLELNIIYVDVKARFWSTRLPVYLQMVDDLLYY